MAPKPQPSPPALAGAAPSAAVAVEVAASASSSEVISAIVASATTPTVPRGNPNKWLLIGFFFVVCFASVVYFREEIYTFTTDIHKYPILSGVEALQVRKYLGSGWTFGTGQDKVSAIDTAAKAEAAGMAGPVVIAEAAANATAAVVSAVGGGAAAS